MVENCRRILFLARRGKGRYRGLDLFGLGIIALNRLRKRAFRGTVILWQVYRDTRQNS